MLKFIKTGLLYSFGLIALFIASIFANTFYKSYERDRTWELSLEHSTKDVVACHISSYEYRNISMNQVLLKITDISNGKTFKYNDKQTIETAFLYFSFDPVQTKRLNFYKNRVKGNFEAVWESDRKVMLPYKEFKKFVLGDEIEFEAISKDGDIRKTKIFLSESYFEQVEKCNEVHRLSAI